MTILKEIYLNKEALLRSWYNGDCPMNEYEKEVMKKIDILIKLQALNILGDINTKKEQVIRLYSVGLKPMIIAEILGISSNSVSVTLSKARSEGIL